MALHNKHILLPVEDAQFIYELCSLFLEQPADKDPKALQHAREVKLFLYNRVLSRVSSPRRRADTRVAKRGRPRKTA